MVLAEPGVVQHPSSNKLQTKRPARKLDTGSNNHHEHVEGRLAQWCIMSPSNQRLRELAAMEVNMTLTKRDLASIGKPPCKTSELKRKPKSQYRWQKLRNIVPFLTNRPTVRRAQSAPQPPPTRTVELKTQTVREELVELQDSNEMSQINYPPYLSQEDEQIIRTMAQQLGLKTRRTETELMVHKREMSFSLGTLKDTSVSPSTARSCIQGRGTN